MAKALRVLAALPLLLVTRLDPIDAAPPPPLPLWWWVWEEEVGKMKPCAALKIWASQALSSEAVEATGAKEEVRWSPPTQRAWLFGGGGDGGGWVWVWCGWVGGGVDRSID